jgi:hypothetical protein
VRGGVDRRDEYEEHMGTDGVRGCIVLITAALSSVFVLLGVLDLIAIGSDTPERFTQGSGISFDAQRDARRARPDPAAILARNVFDPSSALSSRGQPTSPEAVPSPDPDTPQPSTPAPPCESELRIAGTFYNDKHPERSRVVLRAPNARSRAYARGMALGDYTVEQIHPRAVRFQGANGPCWLGMFTSRSREKIAREQATRERHRKAEVAAKPARKRQPARAGTRRPAFSRAELQAGVRQVDSTRFVLQRDFVDAALARMSKIARANAFSMVRNGGRMRGVRIDRLPRRGLLPHVGLERGDVLTSLNGYALGNPKEMMEAYAGLGSAGRLTLVVQRGSNTLTLDYRIQ